MKTQKSNFVIWGCGGHARSVANQLLELGYNNLVFVDEEAKKNEQIFGFPVLKDYHFTTNESFFVAIGDNLKRQIIMEQFSNYNLVSITSRSMSLGYLSTFGKGVFIGNYVHIGPDVTIGNGTIVNNGAVIEHEVQIGDYCHVAPNATISGRSKLGNNVFVGVGATIIDYITICSNVVIGAGSTVISNIEQEGTYVGTPARKIK